MSHTQAQVLHGLLIRSQNLLARVESTDKNFIKERDAAIKDCEVQATDLLRRMGERSPALTSLYTDSAGGDGK